MSTPLDVNDLLPLLDEDIDTAISHVLDLLVRVTGMQASAVFTVDPKDGGTQSVRAVNTTADGFGEIPVSIWPWETSGCFLLRQHNLKFTPNMQTQFPDAIATRTFGCAAYLSIPIEIGAEKQVGATLCAMDRSERHLPQDTIETGRLLARIIARLLEREYQIERDRKARMHAETLLEQRIQQIREDEHRLKTGLAVTAGWLDMIAVDQLEADSRHAFELARRRTAELYDDLAVLIRRERLNTVADFASQPVHVTNLVRDVVAASRGLTGNVDVTVQVEPHVWALAVDTILRDVLEHLLENAMLHGTPPITVTAARHDTHTVITVEDFGRNNTAAASARSTGVGLPTVRRLVDAVDGDLALDIGDTHTVITVLLRATDPPVKL